MHKKCTKCSEEKLLDQYYKKSASKDGFMSYCKVCDSSKSKKYLAENKEKAQLRSKQYYEMNSDKIKTRVSNYYKENTEVVLSYQKTYNDLNKDMISERKKIYRENNREYFREYYEKYYSLNKSAFIARANKRRAAKLNATPKWLTVEHFKQIEVFYIEAHGLSLSTDILHHVDHIVPLQGKTICGLHVPWNLQILTASENRSKSNKLQEHTL